MRKPKCLANSLLLFAIWLVLAILPSCNVNVKKDEKGEDKKVDIETPIGSIHVNKEPDVREIGLPIYPGARPLEKEAQGEQKSAGVNISSSLFGVKVVAQEYESDAPPDKLLAFYSNQLKKYGKVLECQTSWHGHNTPVKGDSKDSNELSCDGRGGDTTELKAGTKENEHIVAVEKQGNKSKFALVLIQVRGKEGMI